MSLCRAVLKRLAQTAMEHLSSALWPTYKMLFSEKTATTHIQVLITCEEY